MILRQTSKIWNLTDGIYDCDSGCLLFALWYFSYTIKGKARSARNWVRCIVRWLICLHTVQIFITTSWTKIYQPLVNQNSQKFPLHGQTVPLWNVRGDCHSDPNDCHVTASVSATWASVVEEGQIHSGEICIFLLLEICFNISTLMNK